MSQDKQRGSNSGRYCKPQTLNPWHCCTSGFTFRLGTLPAPDHMVPPSWSQGCMGEFPISGLLVELALGLGVDVSAVASSVGLQAPWHHA